MNEETLGRLARRELAPREIADALRHLETCPDCARLAATMQEREADALQTRLAANRDPFPTHPDHSELAAYGDAALGPAEREIVDSHLDDCPSCRTDVSDLAALRRPLHRPLDHPRRRAWRVAITAAAAAVIVVIAILQRRDDTPPPPPPHPPITTTQATATTTTTTAPERPRYEHPEWERLVTTALATAILPFPQESLGTSDTLRGPQNGSKETLSPAGVVIDDTRPRFTWPARAGATYVVSLFAGETEIAHSSELSATHWTPPPPLPRGRTYIWQVAATREGTREILPAPPAPPATFRITSQRDHDELAEARRLHPTDHVLHAVLAARAGLRAEALEALGRAEGGTGGRGVEGLVGRYRR